MEHTSSDKMAEALKLLDEAAKLKKDELKSLLCDKYTHLRDLVAGAESTLAHSLADARKHAVEAATHAKEVGVEKACAFATDVDKTVRSNPWPYLGGAAAAALLLGFLLGRDRK